MEETSATIRTKENARSAGGRFAKGNKLGKPFAKGNKGGPGNPAIPYIERFRHAMLSAISPEDIQDLCKSLLKHGKAGEISAIREIFDRVLGKANQPVELSGQVQQQVQQVQLVATMADTAALAKANELARRLAMLSAAEALGTLPAEAGTAEKPS